MKARARRSRSLRRLGHPGASDLGLLPRRKEDMRCAHLRRTLPDSRRQGIADFLAGQRGRGHQPLVILLRKVRQGEDLIGKLGKSRLGGGPRLRGVRRGRGRRGSNRQRCGDGCSCYRCGQTRRAGDRRTGHRRCRDRRRERRGKECGGGARGHHRSLSGQCRRWAGSNQRRAGRREAVERKGTDLILGHVDPEIIHTLEIDLVVDHFLQRGRIDVGAPPNSQGAEPALARRARSTGLVDPVRRTGRNPGTAGPARRGRSLAISSSPGGRSSPIQPWPGSGSA